MNKWLVEAEGSLNQALDVAARGDIPLVNLYMLASLLYSERQNMNNEELLKQMSESIDSMVAEDIKHDENSIYQFRFHYVSCYLYCFVVAGKFDEFQYDRIMEYVNDNMSLFSND